MDTPTTDEVRARSELLTKRYPKSDAARDAILRGMLEDDAPVVSSLTGRKIGPPDTPGVEVPMWLRPVAIRAMALRAERIAVTGTAQKRQGSIGTLQLRGFSAGPYSEQYFGPGEAATAKVLDPDPAVHELLWALATEQKRDEWLALWGGAQPPADAVQSFAFGAARRLRNGY